VARGGADGDGVGLDTDRWPRLTRLLLAYLAAHAPPDARVTSIYVAFAEPNQRTLEDHRDKANCGPSYLLALGDFAGGGLRIPGRRASPFDVTIAANRARSGSPFFAFHARDELHGVEPFDGERISVSFYALRHASRLAPKDRARLARLGFRLPPPAPARRGRPYGGARCVRRRGAVGSRPSSSRTQRPWAMPPGPPLVCMNIYIFPPLPRGACIHFRAA